MINGVLNKKNRRRELVRNRVHMKWAKGSGGTAGAAQSRGTSDKVKHGGRSGAGRTEWATEDDENKGE